MLNCHWWICSKNHNSSSYCCLSCFRFIFESTVCIQGYVSRKVSSIILYLDKSAKDGCLRIRIICSNRATCLSADCYKNHNRHVGLVQSGLHHRHFNECSLFSPWYCWTIFIWHWIAITQPGFVQVEGTNPAIEWKTNKNIIISEQF